MMKSKQFPAVEEYKKEIAIMLTETNESDSEIIRSIYTILLRYLERRKGNGN